MRKLTVLLIAAALFLMLAVPALAGTTADVKVTIEEVSALNVEGTWAMTINDPAQYTAGGAETTGAPVKVWGWNNCKWDLHVYQGPWDTGMTWTVYLKPVGGDWTGEISGDPKNPTVLVPEDPGGTPGPFEIKYDARFRGLLWGHPKGPHIKILYFILTGHC